MLDSSEGVVEDMRRIGHYASEVITAIVLWIVISLWIPLPLGFRVGLSSVLVSAVLLTYVAIRRHNKWCDYCVTPLDPEYQADRNRDKFKMVHLSVDAPIYVALYVFAFIVSTLMIVVNTNMFTTILWSLMILSLVYVLNANILHQRLAPWCFRCRKRGWGKDKECDPVPPTPHDLVTV